MLVGQELARLATDLARHDRLYFELAAPAISDEQYDALASRNATVEAAFPSLIRGDSRSHRLDPPPLTVNEPRPCAAIRRVGSAVRSGARVAHLVPLLSLEVRARFRCALSVEATD